MAKTHVKLETFKNYGSNKHYESLEYDSMIPCWDAVELKKEAELKVPQKDMHYTMEVNALDNEAWNKYLIIKENDKS